MPFDANVGWISRTSAEYQQLLRDAIDARRADLGLEPITDYSEDTVWGLIVEAVALQLGDLDEGVGQVIDSRSPFNATGESLTDIAAITGIAGRLPATYSTVLVGFTGTPGTVIPSGLTLRDADGQDWRTTEAVTLVSPGAGSTTLRAAEPGVVEIGALTTWTPQTAIAGLDAVFNTSAAIPGRPVETDTQLRVRMRDLSALGGDNTTVACRAACLLVDDVQQCEVLNNRTDSIVTQYGHTMAKHSMSVFVFPTLSAAQEEQLADAILAYTPGGIELNGTSSLVRPIPDTDPVEYTDADTIKWTYQTEQVVDVDIVVELQSGYSLSQVTDAVNDVISSYQTELLEERILARKIRRLPIQGRLYQVPGIAAADVLLDGADADVTLGVEYYPTLDLVSLTEGTP